MKKERYTFTLIVHSFLKEHKLSPYEYMLCNMVYCLSERHNGAINNFDGYCYAKKQYIADELGITRRHVITMINEMCKRGFLERNEHNHLKTTEKWNDVYWIQADEKQKSER